MIPDTRQLECFVAVAEEGHIGRAATRLHMTQPPLTRRIKRLERDLDVVLFFREPGGVRLTAPGEALLGEARRLLVMADKAVTLTQRVHQGQAGHLLIGYFGSTVFDQVPRLLAGFHDAYPDIRLTLEQVPKVEQIEALRDGLLHIGFGRLFKHEDGIEVRRIVTEPLWLAAGKSHPLAGSDVVSLSDLSGQPMVLYPRARPSFADQVIQLCEASGFQPDVAYEAEDAVSALTYVAVGVALAIVPKTASNIVMPGVGYVPIDADAVVEFSCVFPSSGRPPALETLLSYLDTMGEDPNGSPADGADRNGTPETR